MSLTGVSKQREHAPPCMPQPACPKKNGTSQPTCLQPTCLQVRSELQQLTSNVI